MRDPTGGVSRGLTSELVRSARHVLPPFRRTFALKASQRKRLLRSRGSFRRRISVIS